MGNIKKFNVNKSERSLDVSDFITQNITRESNTVPSNQAINEYNLDSLDNIRLHIANDEYNLIDRSKLVWERKTITSSVNEEIVVQDATVTLLAEIEYDFNEFSYYNLYLNIPEPYKVWVVLAYQNIVIKELYQNNNVVNIAHIKADKLYIGLYKVIDDTRYSIYLNEHKICFPTLIETQNNQLRNTEKIIYADTNADAITLSNTNYFHQGTVIYPGKFVNTNERLITYPIKLFREKTYIIKTKPTNKYRLYLATFDKDLNNVYLLKYPPVLVTPYLTQGVDYIFKADCDYLYVGAYEKDGVPIDVSSIEDGYITLQQLPEQHSNINLNIVSWNEGGYNFGNTNTGMINNESVDDNISKLKKGITDFNADIYFAQEHTSKLVVNTDKLSLPLYSHFYPYTYLANDGGSSIFSKYPMYDVKSLSVPSGRSTNVNRFAKITLAGKEIVLVDWHGTVGKAEDVHQDRITDNAWLVNFLKDYEYVIIGSDTNVENVTENMTSDDVPELKVFTDAGYTLGNFGYWDKINTYYRDYYPIDNIIVKGFIINNFKRYDDRMTSDHYPVLANLTMI